MFDLKKLFKEYLPLYFVTDHRLTVDRLLEITEQCIKGGTGIVQLREKESDGKEFYEKAYALKQLLEPYKIPLIINDRIDVALAVEAEGVHIGQHDIPLEAVMRLVPPHMYVGVSARTLEEARAAERIGADYIGVGSVFQTKTKLDTEALVPLEWEKIKREITIPKIAIGGIHEGVLEETKQMGFDGFAVISALSQSVEPYKTAKNLITKFGPK